LTDAADFIRANTVLTTAHHVPEIRLHLATDITPIWQATETWLVERNIAPPFWAFAWPGGQALARHILDRPGLVAGKRVLDFAAGGGIAAIACVLAGAAAVEASEIDGLALAAIALNAAANVVPGHATNFVPGHATAVVLNAAADVVPAHASTDVLPAHATDDALPVRLSADVVGQTCRWDLILCGDICYEAPMTGRIMPWLTAMARTAEVWIADPGRTYLPKSGLAALASYRIETTLELEDHTFRDVTLYRVLPGA
jgi:predicted nicotinamide N-methyase